jgi:hypothetical protein
MGFMLKMKREAILNRLWIGLFALLLCVISKKVDAQNSILDGVAIKRARIYGPVIADAASRHGVDPRLLWVIAYLETRFDPRLVSRKGARGLMQFMPDTAQRYGLTNPHDPAAAIDASARYVRYLLERFGNRTKLVLAAYNAGETVVEAYLTGRPREAGDRLINPKEIITDGIPPYRETRKYVEDGLKILENFPSARLFQKQNDHLPPLRDSVINNDGRNPARKSIRPIEGAETQQRPNNSSRRSIYYGVNPTLTLVANCFHVCVSMQLYSLLSSMLQRVTVLFSLLAFHLTIRSLALR